MKTRPHILITNDDGINAQGITNLWNALHSIADITIVAPASEQSGVGLGITTRDPLRIERHHGFGSCHAWSVTGTPADCVKMALNVVMDRRPDFIVSGINRGTNAGRNVLYSGTVAGAIEGVFQGIPSLAFSCWDYKDPDYLSALPYIPAIVHNTLLHPLPFGTLLNVNFPPRIHEIKGVKLARQGKAFWKENPDKRNHPSDEHSYYWMGIQLAQFEETEDSDIHWLHKGYVAAVPMHVGELTDHKHLSDRKASFEALFL